METSKASYGHNGAGHVEGGLHKDLNKMASYTSGQHSDQSNQQPQSEAEDELTGSITTAAEDLCLTLAPDTQKGEEKVVELSVEIKDVPQSGNLDGDEFKNAEPRNYLP